MRNTFLMLTCCLLFTSSMLEAQTTDDEAATIVTTATGKVKGKLTDAVVAFKGIPYAAAPVGNLRFATPAPHPNWDGVRDYIETPPTAPFVMPKPGDINDEAVFGKGWVKGDDYLTVNIWKPVAIARALPVMVFIHGGAFAIGTSSVPIYDGTSFAKKGSILVTFNYRLGIEGFLKIKGVPTNIGIRDQLAALTWVRDNIAAFGGDPEQVTLFGESAGGMSVAVLTVCPAAKGLFKRAIMLSGSGQSVLSSKQAEKIAASYARELKIENNRKAWLGKSSQELLDVQPKINVKKLKLGSDEYPDPTGGVVAFFPVIDGDLVPDIPLRTMMKQPSSCDLLLGFNTDEANYFLVPTGLLKKIKLEIILKLAAKAVHPAPTTVIAVYRQKYPAKNRGELFSSIVTAYQFKVPTIRFADAHTASAGKTYMYEFGWQSAVAGGVYGAYHGLALPFVFNTLESVKGDRGMIGNAPVEPGFADKIQDAFINFAKNGNPGWEPYTRDKQQTMLINTKWELKENPYQTELPVWDGVR
ncbi:MAG: carboxylesterase family protein [Ferruginibacter sp.]